MLLLLLLLLLLLRHPATPWYAVPARVPIGLIPVPDPLDNPPLCAMLCTTHTTFIQAYAYDVPPKTRDGR